MQLKVYVEKKEEGAYIVTLIGSLDSDTYTEFENKLQPLLISKTKGIILNLEKLTYVSSIGIGTIFKAKQFMERMAERLLWPVPNRT